MEWNTIHAQVWLTSTDIVWERECDDYNQRLAVMVLEDGTMHCRASHWVGIGVTRSYVLTVEKRHIISDAEITALYNLVYFNGVSE